MSIYCKFENCELCSDQPYTFAVFLIQFKFVFDSSYLSLKTHNITSVQYL